MHLQMIKKLEDIANITTGVYEKAAATGDAFYLQSKHFDAQGRFQGDVIIQPEIFMDARLERHLLQEGDILLIAKGEYNRACLYNKEVSPAVASSTFFVIRLKDESVLPEYLQWYFNTAFMQSMFSSLSRGTQIASLSKKSVAQVEAPVPPVPQQKRILEIQGLWEKEQALASALLEQKGVFYQNLLLNLAKSNPKDA